ncbi:MAG: hypothetical protein OXC48_01020 [Endozoicomonadaceae bacterium]|nr:hypothetical protein [Endozoicomonadaceae bacterium]
MEPLKQYLAPSQPATELPAQPQQPFVSAAIAKYQHRKLSILKKGILKLILPEAKYLSWENQKNILKGISITALQQLPHAANIATQLDEGVYDRHNQLSWSMKTRKDPLEASLQSLLRLNQHRAAKPYNRTERVLQIFTGAFFKKTNLTTISSYLKNIILHTYTPEGLAHIHRTIVKIHREKQIPTRQFYRLRIMIQQQIKSELPYLCAVLQQPNTANTDSQEANRVMQACYDLAVSLKTFAPRLLLKKNKFCAPLTLGAWLEAKATKAYKMSVEQLPQGISSDDAKATLDHSLMQLHEIVKPTLRITTGRKLISEKKLQHRVTLKLRKIQKETAGVHYELVKLQKMKSEAFSHHEALQKKYEKLHYLSQKMHGDLKNLRAYRNMLRAQIVALQKEREHEKTPLKRKKELGYTIKKITPLIPSVTENIRNLQQKVIRIDKNLNDIFVRRKGAELDKKKYDYATDLESRRKLGDFYLQRKLNKEQIRNFQNKIRYVEQELYWTPEQVDLLFENYVQWLDIPYIKPHDALHQLRQVIAESEHLPEDATFDLNTALLAAGERAQSLSSAFSRLAATVMSEITPPVIHANYQQLIQNYVINRDNIEELNTFFTHFTEQFSQEQMNMLFEYYAKWTLEYDITNQEALQYIDEAAALMQQQDGNGNMPTLQDCLEHTNMSIIKKPPSLSYDSWPRG